MTHEEVLNLMLSEIYPKERIEENVFKFKFDLHCNEIEIIAKQINIDGFYPFEFKVLSAKLVEE